MIDLRGITKVYETDAGPFLALKGIDLQVYPGEFVAVVGKSGSGKSTLINMFTGIDHPTGGEVDRRPDARSASWTRARWPSGAAGTWASSSSSSSSCPR